MAAVREVTGLNVNEILDQTVTWTLNWLSYVADKKRKEAEAIRRSLKQS